MRETIRKFFKGVIHVYVGKALVKVGFSILWPLSSSWIDDLSKSLYLDHVLHCRF